jgi:predicted nucleic acid-binding protein
MPKIVRQTIRSKGVNYLKAAVLLVGTVFLMNMSIKLLTIISPILSSIVAIVIIGAGIVLIYNLVMNDLSNYIYKIIGRELIIERIISRKNHVYYNIGFNDVLIFQKHNLSEHKIKVTKGFRFVQTRDKENWYYLEYNKKGQRRGLIFEPELGLVRSIQERLKENENK